MFAGVGNWVEQKRILIQSLRLWRERGKDYRVADALVDLSDTNRKMGLYGEGIQQVREALEIFDSLGKTGKQAHCLLVLAWALHQDEQLDAAEDAASRAMDFLENRDQHQLCQCHLILGKIHRSKGDREKALHHYEASLQIASSLNSHSELFEIGRAHV